MTERFLFIPVSGPTGSGELQRALVLARAVQRRWPQAQIHFAVSRQARGADSLGFPVLLLDQSPTRSTPAVVGLMEELHPTVVVFDGAARIAQLRKARALGACTVFVSSRPSGRRKVLKWRRLRHLDQVWFTQPQFLEPPLTRLERWKVGRARNTELISIGPVFTPLDHESSERTLGRHRLTPGGYAVFCLGLAAKQEQLQAVQAVFSQVANDFTDNSDTVGVLIGAAGASSSQLLRLAPLPNSELIVLLAHARFACVNGGSLLLQALAVGTACVAVPVNADQPARIAACERRGLAVAATADAVSVLKTVETLDRDAQRRERMHRAIAAEEITNGVPSALAALERLMKAISDE